MSPASIEGCLDLGCIARTGISRMTAAPSGMFSRCKEGPPRPSWFNLISQLQFSGTVPMIDVQASRRDASGEIDWTGRISKCGMRSYLYGGQCPAHHVVKWSALKAWGSGLRSEPGFAKPRLLSRESLPLFFTMWIEGIEFNWSSEEATNQPA
jgi:hypothetical protein